MAEASLVPAENGRRDSSSSTNRFPALRTELPLTHTTQGIYEGMEGVGAHEVIIESAAGIAHVEEIAASSPRLQAMSLGAADFAASMGMQTTGIGGTQENYYMAREGQKYWSDPWHWAQAAIVAACRTHGVLPVDGPFGDFSDDEGFRAQALRSATLGMVGKWAIHPKQIALANEVFTPSEAAVAEAREILAAMEEAQKSGAGAAVYKGRLVDIASVRQAQVIVRQSEMIHGV